MTLRSAFDAGECAIGLHRWSAESESARACVLVRRCELCPQVAERVEHRWGDWRVAEGETCVLAQTCVRCSESERRIEHGWGPWQYHEEHRSPIRACDRCALRVSAVADHRIEPCDHDPPPVEQPAVSAITQLRRFYEQHVAAGKITPERQAVLAPILAEVEQAAAQGQAGAGRIQELMGRFATLLMDPSRPQPATEAPAGSRADVLRQSLRALYASVVQEISQLNLTGATGEAAVSLLGQLTAVRETLAATPPDEDPTPLEVEGLRHAALNARRFALRDHLTFADPVWPSAPVTIDASAVCYSGGAPLADLLVPVCDERGLRVLLPQGQREPGSLRWEQLRQSAIAVFDLTGYARDLPLEDAAGVAAVTYELGIALALGLAVLIVARDGQALPFDVDVEPLRIEDGDHAALASALDGTLYGIQRGTAGNSVQRSIEHLRGRFEAHATPATIQALDVFDAGVARDSILARQQSTLALGFLDSGAPQLLLPTWPGRYPLATAPRCFHATPFGPRFEQSTDAVSEACQPDIEYIRGDRVLDPDILRSIWDEIGTATHVVCDLTGLNPNVALELGLAHTLGRNVLVISQDDRPERHFPAVAKVRSHGYSLATAAERTRFDATLRRFLSE